MQPVHSSRDSIKGYGYAKSGVILNSLSEILSKERKATEICTTGLRSRDLKPIRSPITKP